ncbi:syringomycin biosynthesis enzyme [Planctomycetota bacterium]|nr:syringomycin biosynthesis enzyme [Planctomycetota bacterium]
MQTAPQISIQPRLNPDQVTFYRHEGYLLPQQQVFSEGKFSKLQGYFEHLLQRWVTDGHGKSPEHMDVPHFAYPELMEWLLDDQVLDLVEPILGPDICLFSSHFLCKPAGVGKRVPWHEDSSYWKGRMDPMEVVTVWLAIDPSDLRNSAMHVIPRSHNEGAKGFSRYHQIDKKSAVFDSEIDADQVDDGRAVPCILKPGECSLHDGRLIHGSTANTSPIRRCGYTMRYTSTRVLHKSLGDGFQVYLARGKDHAGNTYGDPGNPNRAWAEKHPGIWPRGH